MAESIGLVQQASVSPNVVGDSAAACFWIGPTPTNTEVLTIVRSNSTPAETGAFMNSMVDALVAAHLSRQEVVVTHGDTSSIITSVAFEPT